MTSTGVVRRLHRSM